MIGAQACRRVADKKLPGNSDQKSSAQQSSAQQSRARDDGVGRSNNVQRLREERLLSKAELARRAGVSVLTIDRVERGAECRLDTKRKIILALGLKVTDRGQVFED